MMIRPVKIYLDHVIRSAMYIEIKWSLSMNAVKKKKKRNSSSRELSVEILCDRVDNDDWSNKGATRTIFDHKYQFQRLNSAWIIVLFNNETNRSDWFNPWDENERSSRVESNDIPIWCFVLFAVWSLWLVLTLVELISERASEGGREGQFICKYIGA